MKKKEKLGRKLLSFILTLALVLGLMPGMGMTVHAAEDDQGYTLVDDNWILDSDHNGPVKVNGNDVTIDLNGHSIIGNGATSTIIIIEGCTLTLKDSAEGGKVTGGGGEVGGGVQVSNNTTFHLQGGEISGNTATNAGGVAVGIGATFDMTGGVICNNTATNGGGVYSSGTFHMSGGKISGNIALDSGVGGGVVAQSGSFTVSGTSQIVNNIAHEGGGVYNSTEMIVNGGEINANTAYGSGGGIYNTRDGSLSVNGGTIDNNNTGNWAGGGVFNAGILTVSDGSISNNTARTEGGAIYSYDTLTISGGHISNNNSGVKGFAGICAQNGTFTLSGNPVIEDNKHNGSEEDICLYPGVIITVPGALTMTNTMSLRRTDSNGHNSWTGVIAQGSGEYMLTEEDAAKFVATTPDRIVKYVNNKAQMNERYHVFYDANGGTGTVPTDDTWYESGDTVTVKETSGVTPNFGWSRNIYGSGETYTENATFEITSNTTLYAKRVDGIVESTSMLGRYIHEPGRNQSASLPLSEDHIYITGVSGTHNDVSGNIVLRNAAQGSYWALYFKGNNETNIYWGTPYPPLGVYFDSGSGTSEDPYVTGWNYNRANGTELSVFHPGDRINGVDVDAKTSTGITFVAASDKWVRFSGDDNYYPLSSTESTTFTGLTADTKVYVYGNYNIVYDGNGNTGGSTSNSESFPAGSDGTIAENGFVKELYRFKGWNTKADGSGIRYYPGDHIVSDESVTLYAQWELYQYKITYDGNGNDSGNTDTTITEIGTEAEVAANGFEKTSYKFSGWNTERNGSGESYAVGDQISDNTNRTLYAQWIPSDETFTFSAPGTAALFDGWNSAGRISVSPGEDVFPEGNKLIVSAESENGWNIKLNTTQVSYGLKDTENGSDTTAWEFTKEDVINGKTYPLGIQITVPDDLAYGIYSDKITFKGEFVSTKPQYLNELVQYNDYGNMNFSCLYYFEQILEHGDYCGKTIDAELAKSIARYKKSETGQNCIVFYGADGDDGLFARSDGGLGRIAKYDYWNPDNFELDGDWNNVYAYGIPSTAVGAAAEPFTTEVKTLGTMTVTHKVAEPATVAEAPVAVEDLAYTGDELTLITAGSTTEGTMQYTLGTDDSTVPQSGWSENLPIGIDAGTYYVWYKVVGDDNHQDYIPTSPVTVTIEQATVNLTWGTTKFTYDGTDKFPTAEITAGIVGDDDCTVEVSGEQTDVNTGDSTYTATAKLTGNDSANYKIAEADKTTTFTINAKAMTVTAADVEVTYDGKEHKITVNVADPADATITYKKAGDTEYSIANPTFTDAGEYEVSYKVTKANYTEFTGTATVKINKKAALTVTADAKNITYGDEDVVLTYKVEGLTGSDKAEDVLTGALTREAGTDAGTYKIEQGSLTSAEYGIAFVGADYVIAKASQAAPAESFTISKATGSDTIDGKISGFAGTKTYQISSDNGATWTDVKAGETSLVVKAGVYQIRYAGDKNHEAGASVSVTVGKKADQSKPEGLEAVNVSAEDAKDGEIIGVSDTMEYSVDKGTTWKAVPANADKIDGLAAGEVLVRYAETDDKNAGSNTTVTVGVASKTEGVVEFKPEEGGTDVEEKAITGVDNESTKASVDDFAETQQEKGKDVKVVLEITTQKEENVNKESVEETNKVVEEVFAGIDSEKVVTEYLAIDVAKYVDNVKETENISDTKSPLEIALKFDSKKSNPVVVRTHDGKAKAFGKLRSRPAQKDYKDAMFYIDPENAILYIYSQYFSDFAIVYATETTYNVGFVSGTGVNLSPLVVAEGGKVTLPTGLKNDGYAFDGWYQDEAYKTAWKDSDTVNADITLYAKWNKSVSGVSVSPSEAMFTKAGETSQIKTTVTPADAANTKVTYKSSDTNVATVDANGKITAVANGTATITVTTEDGAKTATVKVTVSIPEVKQQGTEEPVQQPTKEEKAVISMNAGLKISQTGSKINIKWGKVGEADGYDVYVAYCGKKFGKAVKTINKNSTTSVTVKKINSKKINLKKNFKVYVAAYKMTDGKKEVLAKSIMGHVVGRLNTRYSNVWKITLSKSKYSVKVGKTVKVKAKTVLVDKSKKQLSDAHAAQFRYASSNRNIATVDKNGKVKGVAKGTCTIYVYARNGYAKTVKVTVK